MTIHETGKSGQSLPDKEVLSFANIEGRILLTLNRKHFIRLHNTQQNHAGIIVCTFDLDFVGQAQRIHKVIESQKQIFNQLIRVNRPMQPPGR